MKNNSPATKLLMLVISLAVAAYFGIQTYRYFMDPLSATKAYAYQVEEEISLSGYVVRQESILPDEESGLLRLDRKEGERVSAGGAVATVYADQASLDRQEEIQLLTSRIEQLEYAKEAALGAEVALRLDNQIKQNLLSYRGTVVARRFYDMESQGSNLRALILNRDYTSAEGVDLTEQIEVLKAELKELKKQSSGSVRKVKSSVTGLYSAVVDGYEQILTPGSVSQMLPSELSSLSADGTLTSQTGKLVLGDSWYYAAVMTVQQAEALQEAEGNLHLRFTKGVERDLKVEVHSVSPEENGRCVVVLRGNTFLQEVTLLRRQSAEVIFNTIEGIRVPKAALRIRTTTVEQEDGGTEEVQTTGVYCIVGMEARFKPVKVLYSGDGFALVTSTASPDQQARWLRHGDEVIISSRDLYDGKVVGDK